MELHVALITLGILFLTGLIANELGRRTRLPRVTLLMLLGMLAGPMALDLLPPGLHEWQEFLSSAALTMVAFLLGGSLSHAQLVRQGRMILTISITVVLTTVIIVGGGLLALGIPAALAILLAGIAAATAPAATLDTIREAKARGEFADTLKGVVAIDDLWGLILFSLLIVVANSLGGGGQVTSVMGRALWEIGGAVLVGGVIGYPAALLTGRIQIGEPLQSEALAVVFLCAGLSIWLEVSFLLAGVVAGAIIANFARHHTRAFHEIEHIEWPFMILFFFLAGASLQSIPGRQFLFAISAFVVLRAVSRIIGGWLGGTLCAARNEYRRWMGLALMPQAGVAIGMALIAGNHFPEFREYLLMVTLGSTVIFEIFGPLATRIALKKTKGL